jgi:flagellar biosynthesis/type III secretory pathway chaperone
MTDFNLLHKIDISIGSYKNTLSKANTLEQVCNLADKVTDLERQIIEKGDQSIQQVMGKRESLLKKIEQCTQEIQKIDHQYTCKIQWYKQQVKRRIEALEIEVENKKQNLHEVSE